MFNYPIPVFLNLCSKSTEKEVTEIYLLPKRWNTIDEGKLSNRNSIISANKIKTEEKMAMAHFSTQMCCFVSGTQSTREQWKAPESKTRLCKWGFELKNWKSELNIRVKVKLNCTFRERMSRMFAPWTI